MKKKKILLYVLLPIVIVAVLVFVVISALQNVKGRVLTVDGLTLAASDLQSEISATGTVESTESKNVFSSLTYPVQSIAVEVGDKVNAGDVLAILDSDELKQQIEQQEATLEASNITSSYQLSQSEKTYNEAKNNLDNGMNAELRSAQTALKSAELDLKTAKDNYDKAQKNQNTENSDNIVTAQKDMTTAQINYSAKKSDYQTALRKDVYTDEASVTVAETKLTALKATLQTAKASLRSVQGGSADVVAAAAAKVDQAKTAYNDQLDDIYDLIGSTQLLMQRKELETYSQTYDDAKDAYDKLITQVGGDIATYQKTLDSAQIAYDNALSAYEATTLSVNQQLTNYKADMDKNRATVSNEPSVLQLAALKTKLDKCTITAPISGTVTSVKATEGGVPSGVMFTVEDTEALLIKANVKEYDIAKISENMKVRIESDATGDDSYEGYISRIAPTANKDSSTSGTQFAIEVTVTSADNRLKIGMSTRLNIITEEQKGVIGVRYDALGEDEDGNSYVYVAKDNGDGNYTAQKAIVTTGIETDFEVEISGADISSGTIVITDLEKVKDGSVVRLSK